MSSHRSESGFLRKLAWTVVLALVFSAGLITGQRMIRSETTAPLVSVSSSTHADAEPPADESTDEESSRPLFSFYDRLSKGVDSAPSTEKSADRAAAESQPAERNAESSDDEDGERGDSGDTAEPTPDDGSAPGDEDSAPDDEEPTPSDEKPASDDERPASKEAPADDSNETGSTRYTLQVSAYPSLERARARIRSLSNKGLDAHVVSADVPDKGTYYRVRIGKFRSMEEAQNFQEELTRKRGVDTFVTPL